MKKINRKKRVWLVIVLCLIFAFFYSNAFAKVMDRPRAGHGREVVKIGRQRYNYHDGRFYKTGWFGLEFALSVPPIGAVVTTLPFGYRKIAARGTPYFYYENIYYRQAPAGYIVVPAPAADLAVVPAAATGGSVIVNVPNSNGSYTPVKLVKTDNGYVGPQGEYYSGNPSVEQLKAFYGK